MLKVTIEGWFGNLICVENQTAIVNGDAIFDGVCQICCFQWFYYSRKKEIQYSILNEEKWFGSELAWPILNFRSASNRFNCFFFCSFSFVNRFQEKAAGTNRSAPSGP